MTSELKKIEKLEKAGKRKDSRRNTNITKRKYDDEDSSCEIIRTRVFLWSVREMYRYI